MALPAVVLSTCAGAPASVVHSQADMAQVAESESGQHLVTPGNQRGGKMLEPRMDRLHPSASQP
jgi:hypothetical protein